MVVLIKNPSEVLKKWVGRVDARSFQLGRVSMALEITTVVRSLELYGQAMGDFEREQIVSVLQTLLREQGLDETAEVIYERLAKWRRLQAIDVSADDADASPHEEPEDEPALGGRRFSLPYSDQSLDPPSTSRPE